MTTRNNEILPRPYHMGREAREASRCKVPPAILDFGLRHWWLAGWNDRDIELTTTQENHNQ